jgi:hypothetical protein
MVRVRGILGLAGEAGGGGVARLRRNPGRIVGNPDTIRSSGHFRIARDPTEAVHFDGNDYAAGWITFWKRVYRSVMAADKETKVVRIDPWICFPAAKGLSTIGHSSSA